MNITIVGTIVKDRIFAVDGTVTESFGGLFYSIEALRAVCEQDDQINPVSFVGSDIYDEVIDYFKNDARVNLNGFYRIEQPNNNVELHYNDRAERTEYSLDPMPALKYHHIAPFLNADLLVINLISGWDIELQDLGKIADGFNGILSMDIHSLTLDREADGKRVRRKLKNPAKWLAIPDIIQMNKKEFESICNSGLTIFYKKYCFDQNKIVNLTLGNQGSLSVYREKNEILKIATPPADLDVVDPTGCGDVFLSAFSCTYCKTKNIIKAAEFANFVAAVAGTKNGLPEANWLKAELENSRNRNDA